MYEEQLSVRLNNPRDVVLSVNGSAIVEQLPVLSGFWCPYEPCGFLITHPMCLIAHYACPQKGYQDVIASSGEPRPRAGVPALMQSFSKGRWARYWTVAQAGSRFASGDDGDGDGDGDGSDLADDSGYESSFDSTLARYSERLAGDEEKRRRTGEPPGGVDVDSPWVAWTGWAEHF